MNIERILISIFLAISAIGPTFSRDLVYEDILIVEIRAADLNLKVKSDAAFQKNVEQRSKFRKAIADFISEANSRARFIIVDAWFPDMIDEDSDKTLLTALKSNPNITVGGGSKRDKEYTHPLSKAAVPRVGHLIYYHLDPKNLVFFAVYCSDWENPKRPLAVCPAEKKEPDIALIALEGFLGEKLKYSENGFIEIPRDLIIEFPQI